MSVKTDDLTVTVKSADGTELHLSTATDEVDRLCEVLMVTTKDGTGYESATIKLARDYNRRYDDLGLLQEVIIEDASGKVLHEGAITATAPESGRVQITSTGNFARLMDRKGFSEIYRDTQTSNWSEQPIGRQSYLLGLNQDLAKISISAESGLVCALPLDEVPASTRSSGGFYTAPSGCTIASITFTGTKGTLPTDWDVLLEAGDDETTAMAGGSIVSPVLLLDGTAKTLALTTPRRFAEISVINLSGGASTPTDAKGIVITQIVVTGDHGLTDITPSTVIKDLLDRYCPSISYDSESITEHPYPIPQLVVEGATPSDVVAQANAYCNWEFGVWEDSRFWFGPSKDLREPDYILDIDNGDTRDLDGRSLSEDYPLNGVEVFYTDALTGRQERVGPFDDARLRSDDEENPCNREGRDRWGRMDISFSCNQVDAIQLGEVWLAENLIPSRSGTGSAIGTVTTASGQEVPASHIRAGDVVRYADEDYGRKVYSTEYQPATQTNTLKFDDAPRSLAALLERLGVRIAVNGAGR